MNITTMANLIQLTAATTAVGILVTGLRSATFPTQETAAAALAAAVTVTGWCVASALRHFAQSQKRPVNQSSRGKAITMHRDTRHAVVAATPEELDRISTELGLKFELVEISDSGEIVYYEAGPSILAEIGRQIKKTPPDWDELDYPTQSAVVMTAATSYEWQQGDLDPQRIDELFQEMPELRARFTER